MKKNKIYIIILFTLLSIISSCTKTNFEKGIIYARSESIENEEESTQKAKNSIYENIAKEAGKIIDRNDYEILKTVLINDNIVDFDIAKIKTSKKDNKFITEIKVKDREIYSRSLESLEKLKKEGNVLGSYRAFGSAEFSKDVTLNAFTKSSIERSALQRAHDSLFDILVKSGVNADEAICLTNQAYIIEETYSSTEYNVIIETSSH